MGEASQTLASRVERLERQNRRMRWLLFTLPGVALLAGAAGPGVWEGKQVVAEEVVLKDKNGKIRVRLAADLEGNGPQLYLLSAKEKTVLAAGQNKENGVGFVEFHAEGEFKGGIGGNAVKK